MTEGYTPEDYTQDGYEGNEAEIIELENRDSWEQTQDGFAKPPEQETTFVDLPVVPVASDDPVYFEKHLKLDDFYKHLEDSGYTVDRNVLLIYKALSEMNDDKELFINYKGKEIRLTHVKTQISFSRLQQ